MLILWPKLDRKAKRVDLFKVKIADRGNKPTKLSAAELIELVAIEYNRKCVIMPEIEIDRSYDTEAAKRKGINLLIKTLEAFIPVLRIEANANTAFNLIEAQQTLAKGLPYIPDSDKSIYIKPPLGSTYITSALVERFETQQTVHLKPLNPANVLYDPQFTWHGGTGGRNLKDSNGLIALRGRSRNNIKQRATSNQAPAIAKDSLAGNYYPIFNVKLPGSLTSYPNPITATSLNDPIKAQPYIEEAFEMSTINARLRDIVFDEAELRRGAELLIMVHNPSPLHKSRMHKLDRLEWIYEPITFVPDEKTALGFTILFFRSASTRYGLGDPITFMGISIDPNQNIGFEAQKIG